MKLTPRQQAFVDHYIQLGNATEAAIRAGYSEKYAGQNADKLLKNTNVRQYLDERNKTVSDSRIADMSEVKRFWTELLRDKEADNRDRLKASEYIAKTNAAFIDKVDATMANKEGESFKVQQNLGKLSVEELKKLESILSKTT